MSFLPIIAAVLLGCGGDAPAEPAAPDPAAGPHADVVGVEATGEAGEYTFAVSLQSPDTGCEQYADWWEVLDPDGKLLYRRILAHSHPDEQPFTRTGGPVAVAAGDEVVVRAHMAPGGYGGAAMRGTVSGGFSATSLDSGWAAAVESEAPQPEGCLF